MENTTLRNARWSRYSEIGEGSYRLVFSGDEGEIEIVMSIFDVGILQAITSQMLYRRACPDFDEIRQSRWDEVQARMARETSRGL